MLCRLVYEFDANANDIKDKDAKRLFAEDAIRNEFQYDVESCGCNFEDVLTFEVIDYNDNPDFDENGVLV